MPLSRSTRRCCKSTRRLRCITEWALTSGRLFGTSKKREVFFFLGRVESTNGSCLVHSQCAYVTYVYRYPGGSVAVFVIGASIRTRRWMEWSPKRISADEVVASRKIRWVIRNRDSDSKATHFDGSRRSFRRSSIANPPRTYSIGSIVNYLILNSWIVSSRIPLWVSSNVPHGFTWRTSL